MSQGVARNEEWNQVAHEVIDYLRPFAPVILLGLESASRQLGRPIDRKEFVNAKSVYAILKTSFERDESDQGRQTLEQFIREPARHHDALVTLVAQRAAQSPQDLGHKLVAISNRWRSDRRALP